MPRRDLLVIGASAGGVNALIDALGDGEPIDAAVLVVLHLAPAGRTSLPEILSRSAKMPAALAEHGRPLQQRTILVAPPDRHLLVGRERVRLSAGPRENRSRPAVDPLFRTAAASHGSRTIAIVLSGMLADGAAGLVSVRRAGGTALVQEPEDAVFPSMPSAALALAGADEVRPACEMRSLIDRLTQEEVESLDERSDEPDVVELGALGLERVVEGGTLTNLTCPECSGSLWEFQDGRVITYRCRVGHAFTADVLVDAQSDGIEDVLWKAVRAHDELASLLLRRAELEHQRSRNQAKLETLQAAAQRALERAERLRRQIDESRADREAPAGDQA